MDSRRASPPPTQAIDCTNSHSPRAISVGPVRIVPATHFIEGEIGIARLEPLMLDVLLVLADRPGHLIDRQHMRDRCWNGEPVGEDSVNRAVAGVRKALAKATAGVHVETVPGSGYTLRVISNSAVTIAAPATGTAVETAWRSWRLGLPALDLNALAALRDWVLAHPDDAEAWGMLALIARNAAEYAEPSECMLYVDECQAAATRALRLHPGQPRANAAIITLPPLFGDWTARRKQLVDALSDEPHDAVLRHELAFLEMATGRPSRAAPIIEALIGEDPLAAIYQYKRVYHLWTLGDLSAMDQVADRSLLLWPRHPAIWFARFWSLTFTGRPEVALAVAEDENARPPMSAAALDLARLTAAAMRRGSDHSRRSAIEANRRSAASGPAMCVAAIIHLAGLGAVDEAFAVARGYFFNDGSLVVPKRRTSTDPAVTDQYRRITQMLFIPATAVLREDARFRKLCDEIGLTEYWTLAGLTPDYLSSGQGGCG